MHLFGDSTPFPLDENYIETMRDAIKVSAALLASDEAIELLRAEMQRVKRSAADEAAEIKRMSSERGARATACSSPRAPRACT